MTGIVKSDSDRKTIYTHDEAARIIDMFEEILEQHNVRIPSPEDEERDSDNIVGLYGSTYADLLDDVEALLIGLIEDAAHGCEVIEYEFSGEY